VHYSKLIIFLLLFSNCNEKKDLIFWVDKPTKNRNDFLFLAESTNVKPIPKDSLKYYLSPHEIDELASSELSENRPVFKAFQKIHKANAFNAIILFRSEPNDLGRSYKFIIRTYDTLHRLIASYDLARWNEGLGEFCYGKIDSDLIIERSCNGEKQLCKIDSLGKISCNEITLN